jgi:putative glutamine amidotransferase
MKPRIAIPVPTSNDLVYNEQSWPQYALAVQRSGGEPVEIPLNAIPSEIANLINTCQAVLLPGSPADVNPHKYGQEPIPECAPTDSARENVDELLIQDAHNLYKPIFAICFGVQFLNVWRGGTLVQDLSPMPVNHPAGRSVAIAHNAAVAPDSLLGSLLSPEEAPKIDSFLRLPINSSHHQAIGIPGDGLRISARCPQDAVIEAVEGGLASEGAHAHFVLGIQWHPERSYDISAASRALFDRFIGEAKAWAPRPIHTSVVAAS